MGCPVCGGTERRPIAPGYWECASTVTETHMVMQPMPARPWMNEQTPVVMHRVCGNRYQERGQVSSAEVCVTCGTFAIGRCMECGRPVCGDCSSRVGMRRLCVEHAPAALAEAREREQAAKRATQREAAEERARQEELDNTPLDMSRAEAFDALFLGADSTMRAANSARRTLGELDSSTFIALALERFREHGVQPERFNITGGSMRGSHGVITRLRMVDVYWLASGSGGSTWFGLTPRGRFVYRSSEGYGSRGYVKWLKPRELVSKLIRGGE